MADTTHDETDRRIEALLREMTAADAERTEPPGEVWNGIETAVAGRRRGDHAGAAGVGTDTTVDGTVVAMRRPPRRWMLTVAAAAAAVLVVVAGLGIVTGRGGEETTVVASAELTYDPAAFDELGQGAVARVSLVDADGTFVIDFDEAVLPDPLGEGADLELWLIQPDDEGNVADLVSLGVLDVDGSGEYRVPDAYDPDEFFVVDISVEPRDGDETHSGRSILRGVLDGV